MRKLSIILILFLAASCKSDIPQTKADQTIPFLPVKNKFISSLVDSIQYLKLENVEEAFISHINKVIAKGDKIFIGDLRLPKIVVYDTNGIFQYALDKKGRGPEEYLDIKSFAVDSAYIYIIDNNKGTLQAYDITNGKFAFSRKMPLTAWDLAPLKNGGFAFCFSTFYGNRLNNDKLKNEQSNYRLFFTDKDLNITHKMFPYTEGGYDALGKEYYFTENENYIVYNWTISDDFFLIDKNNIDSVYTVNIDFGKHRIPDYLKNNKTIIDSEKYSYMYNTPVLNGNYIAFNVSDSEGDFCYLYNQKTKQIIGNSMDDCYNFLMYPDACDSKGRFMYIFRNKLVYDDLISDGFQRADKDVEQHIEDGLVLVYYSMKHEHQVKL